MRAKNAVAHLYCVYAFAFDKREKAAIRDAILIICARSRAANNWIARWAA